MLVSILDALVRRLSTVWRVFGSPRVAGDEKVVSTIKSGWAKKEQASRRAASVGVRTRNALIASVGLLLAAILIWLIISLFGGGDDKPVASEQAPTPTVSAGPEFMTEVQALNFAISAAREAGLVSQNFEYIARRIPFIEYARAIGEADRAERGLLEISPDTEVWAFAFAGDVQLKLETGESVDYDNLTIVLNAITGKVYRTEAFYGEYESEARAPVWLRPPTPTPSP